MYVGRGMAGSWLGALRTHRLIVGESEPNWRLVPGWIRVDPHPMRRDTASRGGGWARRGLHVLAVTFSVVALACAAQPGPSSSPNSGGGSPASAHAEATDGPFELAFMLRKTSWSASEPVEGTASLSVAAPVEVGGSGDGLLGFNYDEIGGLGRHIELAETLDCGPYQLEPGQPVSASLKKAGGYDPAASDADFYASFFADPLVHLPAGNWTITALASFIDFSQDTGCHLPNHQLSAPITVHVLP